MPRPRSPQNLRLLAKISELYYLQNLTQAQIARRLRLSRPKVSRLLQQARRLGIVQITIRGTSQFVELESRLERHYRLAEVVIIETPPSRDETLLKTQLGTAAAEYLHRTLQPGDIIGITWGTTLQAMIQQLQALPIPRVHVVQTLGGIGPPEAEAYAADLSRRLAQLLQASVTLLPAPGIVQRPEAKEILLSDRYVQAALALFPKLTIAYTGIGALTTNPIFYQKDEQLAQFYQELVQAGAVGDIAMRFYDAQGRPVHTSLDRHLIGITLEELKRIPRVVGIAGGTAKVEAIRGALRGGYVKVLITDHETAQQLLP
uniref:Sugar-binding transcriptional regulator n=1 Tax=Rhodothermus marinus TaxID=29549 RepID=A0A7V2B002_RHOMR